MTDADFAQVHRLHRQRLAGRQRRWTVEYHVLGRYGPAKRQSATMDVIYALEIRETNDIIRDAQAEGSRPEAIARMAAEIDEIKAKANTL